MNDRQQHFKAWNAWVKPCAADYDGMNKNGNAS
jgi:hypothetical protein